MFVTLANRITIVRILHVPLFILLVIYYKRSFNNGGPNDLFRLAALVVFGVALSLDVIDGYIARTRNQTSRLGAALDPLADKTLLVSAFLLLSGNSVSARVPHLPLWFVILAISRDLVLILGALLINVLTGTVKVLPRFAGKATTLLQTVVVGLVLLNVSGPVLLGGIGLATLCTVVSGVQYVVDGIHEIERA